MKYICLVTFLLFLLLSKNGNSQCCAAGNPVSGAGSFGEGSKKTLKLSLSYKNSYSDKYYSGNEKLDVNSSLRTFRYTSLNFVSMNMLYGLTDKLKIKTELGFFINKTQEFYVSGYNRHSFGLGDAALALQYSLISIKEKKFKVAPSFKVVLPVGEFDQVYDNITLPVDLQPSSGSFKYNTGIFIYKGFGESNFAMYSMCFAEFSDRIKTELTDYQYGNLYLLTVSGSYKFSNKISAVIQLRDQYREKSVDKGMTLNSTGGNVFFVVPQLNINVRSKWNLSLIYEQPLLKNMNGTQLTNKYGVSVGLSRSFNFNKELLCDTSSADFKSMSESKIPVRGKCGMCKDRIEKVAMSSKNVIYASWDLGSEMLTLKYNEDINIVKIKQSMAKAGHDTDDILATDRAYEKLHVCCKYR